MSNDLTETTGNAVAAYDADAVANYYQQYGDQASARPIRGKLLKFNKGDWLAGQDEEEVPTGTRLVALMDELYIGWVHWKDKAPDEQRMGRVVEGFQPARRKDLGDLDEDEWELDSEGRPQDPWTFSNNLLLRPAGCTEEPDDEDLYTLAVSSRGGLNAIGDLCKVFAKEVRRRPNQVPIVELGVDSYVHKEYGRTKIPVLKVVGWEDRSFPETGTKEAPAEEADEAPAEEAKAAPKGRSRNKKA
jgi:hypothetical protein